MIVQKHIVYNKLSSRTVVAYSSHTQLQAPGAKRDAASRSRLQQDTQIQHTLQTWF